MEPGSPSENTISNLLRSRQINSYFSGMDAIQAQMRAYPNVNWRYLIEEQNPASGMDELNFDLSVTWPLQEQGRAQTLEVLAYGPGYGFDKLVKGIMN